MLKADTTKKLLSLLVLVAFILGVQWFWGWGEILRPWTQLSWPAILLAACLIIVSYQLRTLRIYDYFLQDIRGRWWLCVKLVLIHNILNNIMPMRSGEVSFPLLMKRYFAIDYSRSLPALLWFRLLDLHTILALGMLSLVPDGFSIWLSALVLIGWLAMPVAVYILRNFLLGKLGNSEDEKGWKRLAKKGLSGLPDSHWRFISCWALTWMNWVLKLLVLVWILGQFIALDFMSRLSGAIAGELTSVLPFHAPGGVGTYEVGIAAALLPHTTAELATPAAINLHLFILSVSVIGGIIGYLIPKGNVAPEKV
ncbi:lysylphosphatidylglycerol synthase transmembrane domain-containing protein [Leucothrix mucor]|uniref:lysylphosphatidylglycerol synthase transmembrane domain-containing protein n=1 Tax=Leucothrix mucor TaxID=45248 RepID=UPI0003B49BDE|nr:lysylphosphatidylglycerol synthase transmembrane domain-containing protein [Leucothrix mucor]